MAALHRRFLYLRFPLVLSICCAALIGASASAQFHASGSFETSQTQQVARELMKERRYLEAASYLRLQIQTLPAGANRFPLLLLLADSQLGAGDLTAAKFSIAQAESLIVRPANQRAVAQRQKRLTRLETLQPAIPLREAPESALSSVSGLQEARPYQAEAPITNSFFETDLRQVLTDLSQEASVPILWDATVQGLVTYEAKEQPLEDVLKAILLPLGYTYKFEDGAYYVGSAKPEDPAFGLLSKTAVVTLANLDAADAIGLLSDYFKPYVKASKEANLVCITAPANWIERIKEDLDSLDAPPDQILIEVIVTEIARDALREMGVNWALWDSTTRSFWEILINHTDIANPVVGGSYTEPDILINRNHVNLTASLQALEQSGKAKIRANPRITTLNGRKAEIAITKDQYFIIQTGTSQYYQYNTLQSVSSGIKLEITPFSAASGEITVYVKPEVGDVVGKGANDLPEISRRTAATSVRVMDGETFTIGGLSLQQDKNVQKKIPFLGDIPFLGYFFRYDKVESRDTEIVIFVTPHILKDKG